MRKGEACLAPTLEFGANLGKSEACLAPLLSGIQGCDSGSLGCTL